MPWMKWKYIQDKMYGISAAMLRKRSYFVQEVWPRLPGLGCRVQGISITTPGQPGFSYEHEGKSGEARGEILETEPARPWPGSYEEGGPAVNCHIFGVFTQWL